MKKMRNRRNNSIHYILTTLVLIFIISSCQNTKEKIPMNVLFIAVDDLQPELNCYGANDMQTPNIDQLASNGVLFTQAYIQQSICMASRASVMTGIRPQKKGLFTGESVQKLTPNAITLNKLFEANNYNIAAYGKIYHHAIDHTEQFGDRHQDPQEKWVGRGYLTDESIEQMYFNEAHPLKGRQSENRGPAFESADVPDSAYIDGYNTELALRKLKDFKAESKPFFMAVGFHKPHLPFVAPKKYWDMYPLEDISMPEITTIPENSTRYTLRDWGELRNYYGIPKSKTPIGIDTTLLLRQGYFACVSYVDAQIGKILQQLKDLELDQNTIIVLWGDHGYKLGDYGYWCKWSNMNIDTRIPLIINSPDGQKNEKCTAVVEALDIYPTLAELCGLQVPEQVEGKSLVSLLNHPHPELDQYAYSIWPHDRGEYDKTIMGYAVKDKRFNYIEWVKLNTGEVLAKELYDHDKDPMETRNVVDDLKYIDDVSLLSEKCKIQKENTDHEYTVKETQKVID